MMHTMETPSAVKEASVAMRLSQTFQTHFSNIASPLSWLLIGRFGRREAASWKACFLATLAIALIGIGLPFDHFSTAQRRSAIDGIVGHTSLALILAVDRSLCGTVSSLAPGYNFEQQFGKLGVDIFTTPVLELPAIVYGSTENYCAKVTIPFINNENSLMYIFDVAFWVNPKITIEGLTYWLDGVRYVCLAIFVFSLIRLGFGLLISFSVFVAGVMLTLSSQPIQILSMYPLLMPVTAAFAGVLLIGFYVHSARYWWASICIGLAIGLAGAFLFNLRTSHFPLVVFGSLAFVVMIALRRDEATGRSWQMRLGHAALTLVAICGAIVFFQKLLIAPISRQPVLQNETFHVIFHPLVLSLAFPPGNHLAEQEGIKWDDAVGLDLARRIDPSVNYIGPNYEKALAVYYAKLWIYHTDEMKAIYKAKLDLAGRSAVAYLSAPTVRALFRFAVWPLEMTPSGGAMVVICILVLVGCGGLLLRMPQLDAALIFFVTIICIMDILLTLEKAMIIPLLSLTHQQTSLFFTALSGLLIEQGALIGLVSVGRRAAVRWRSLREE